MSTRPTTLDIPADGSGDVINLKATQALTSGAALGDGHVLHFYWDNPGKWDAQLLIPNSGTRPIQFRRQNGVSWEEWTTVLDQNNYSNYALPLTGGSLTGNLTGQYIKGTRLQTTAASNLSSTASKFAVIDNSGWIWYRTASQTLSDIGAAASSHTHTNITNETMTIYAEKSNEVNFGGTSSSSTIYCGYRAKDSKPIPSTFIFGGSTGTSIIKSARCDTGALILTNSGWTGYGTPDPGSAVNAVEGRVYFKIIS